MTQCKTWDPIPPNTGRMIHLLLHHRKHNTSRWWIKVVSRRQSCLFTQQLRKDGHESEGKGGTRWFRKDLECCRQGVQRHREVKKKKLVVGYLTLQLHALEILLEHKAQCTANSLRCCSIQMHPGCCMNYSIRTVGTQAWKTTTAAADLSSRCISLHQNLPFSPQHHCKCRFFV